MLRPRESRDIKLLSVDITTSPPAAYTWAHDVFGNTVTTVSFTQPVAILTIESHIILEHSSDPWPIFDIAASAISSPFAYSEDDRLDLGVLLMPQDQDRDRRLAIWARGFVRGEVTDTLSLLKDLNAAISAWICTKAAKTKGRSLHWRRLHEVGVPVVILPCCSLKLLDGWGLLRGSCRVTFSTLMQRGRSLRVPRGLDRRMPGPKFTCPARAGSHLIRPIEQSGAPP